MYRCAATMPKARRRPGNASWYNYGGLCAARSVGGTLVHVVGTAVCGIRRVATYRPPESAQELDLCYRQLLVNVLMDSDVFGTVLHREAAGVASRSRIGIYDTTRYLVKRMVVVACPKAGS